MNGDSCCGGWITTSRMLPIALAAILLCMPAALAQPTNALSDAEIQGRALVQRILEQRPANNYTNTGVLEIRNERVGRLKLPVQCVVLVGETNWQTVYSTLISNSIPGGPASVRDNFSQLTVIHSDAQPNVYRIPVVNPTPTETNLFTSLGHDQLTTPFANSDFWYCDLGLEFFHWPRQALIKKEFRRNCACMVLESTNPYPTPGGYSNVVCWIDEDSLGIVEAYAYDVNGKELKFFEPKSFEKVDKQYQVKSMFIENEQTHSRSTLDFDFEK